MVLAQRSCFATLGRNVKRKLDSEKKKITGILGKYRIRNSIILRVRRERAWTPGEGGAGPCSPRGVSALAPPRPALPGGERAPPIP